MNGKINAHGNLEIERKGVMSQQYCPFSSGEMEFCGDWCPMLGEPLSVSLVRDLTELCLCKGVLNFETFEDERKEDEELDNLTFGTGQN